MPARAASSSIRLDFSEKLIQSGKGGGTDALLKRLKTLHVELKALDQDIVELKTVHKVTKQLIATVILHHKDRGVKAFAACCLADVLRLYAPDAPYNADQLRDIFQFFIVQISQNLKLAPRTTRPLAPSKRGNDSSSQSTLNSNARITEIPYFTEYCYLIDNLANIKSVVLVVDVPGAEELITTYFEELVDCVRADMNKQLVRNLVSILVEVLQEADTVPAGVMECILNQFETFANKPDTPSFQMVVDVCNRAAVKLQRPMFAQFSDIQLSHGRDPSPTDLKTLTESHEVLLTIYRHAPHVLLNVIPLLEENLRAADETPLRQLSTTTLGTMFGERPVVVTAGVVDLARSNPATWRAWLGRRVDKAVSVRVAWIEAARDILVSHPELRKELEPCLLERIQDSDERARAAICKVIGSVDYETALHHVSEELLRAIGQRMSDKKASVRGEAVTALAKLWSLAQTQLEANDEDAVIKFGWIPQEMLNAIQRAVGPEAKTQISIALKTHVLPLPSKPDDEQAWVDRFLLVASRLDNGVLKTLDRLTGIYGYAKGSSPYRAFVETCEKWNGGGVEDGNDKQIKRNLDFIMDAIAQTLFGDADKARKDLERFATINEPRLYKLFRSLVDPQTGLRETIKARNELLRRIEQSHTSILETFSVVIDSAAWMIVNQSSIPGFIKRIQRPEGSDPERTAQMAAHYLALIAKHCAPMFKSHVPVLVIIVNDKKNDTLVEIGFQALAAVCKWDTECAPTQKGVLERAKTVALNGTPRQAKFAARFLVYCKDPKAAPNLVEAIWEELETADAEQLLPLLRAASELALSAPQHFKDRGKEIGSFILNDLMLRPSPSAGQQDDRWADEDQLEDQDRAKLIGMSVLTHQSLGWAREDKAVELVDPTLKFLSQVARQEGMITSDTEEGGQARVHLRLRATLCLIKLARVRSYDKAMSPYFGEIALVMQDPIFTVRQRMLLKLGVVLPPQRLMPRWNLLPILTAIDPELENRVAAVQIMGSIIRTAPQLRTEDRIDRVEMPLARLLHLLALHPDLDWQDDEALKDIAKFIEMFVDCVARRDNVALLYTIAAKLKTVSVVEETIDPDSVAILTRPRKKADDDDVDMDNADQPEKALSTINLYKMSEMAQIILRTRAQHHQWPMSVYPGKIKLPSDIFNNLPSPQVAQIVSRKTFLPDNAEWMRNLGKQKGGVSGQRRAAGATEGRSPRPRKRKSTAGGSKAAAPRKKRRSSGRSAAVVSDTESEIEASSDEDSDDESDDDDDGEGGEESAESDGEAVAVLGRGGRRNAKTKAKKAVRKKRKVKSPTKKSPTKKRAADTSSELSDLSDG